MDDVDDEMLREPANPQDDGPRWHIVQIVPLPTAGQPTQPHARDGAPSAAPLESSEQPEPAEPVDAPVRPTRVPTSRPLWGDLDALLTAHPTLAPMEADLAEAARRQAGRRRRRLMRRLRRMGVAAVFGVALGAGIWWWGPGWLHHGPSLHLGSRVPSPVIALQFQP